MKIQVTQEDIDNGCERSAHCCPIAKAILRAIPKAFIVYVYPAYPGNEDTPIVKIGDKKFLLPVDANEFAIIFDIGGKKHSIPFEFEFNCNL